MTTLIAILQFLSAQGVTLEHFEIETHEFYYSETKCEQFKDKEHFLIVCPIERKLIISKNELIK